MNKFVFVTLEKKFPSSKNYWVENIFLSKKKSRLEPYWNRSYRMFRESDFGRIQGLIDYSEDKFKKSIVMTLRSHK